MPDAAAKVGALAWTVRPPDLARIGSTSHDKLFGSRTAAARGFTRSTRDATGVKPYSLY